MEQHPKILFIDDESAFLQSLQRILHFRSRQWEMHFCLSVDEALDRMHEDNFDLIITDIKMPRRDGFDFLTILKTNQAYQDIPVVVLTGSGETHLKSRALDLGATDLLNKPIDSVELISRIENSLKLKFAQDQIKNYNTILETRVRERTAELEAARLDIIWRLAKAGEYRDYDTGNHIIRVGHYSKLLAGKMDLPPEQIRLIFLTSPLHDIGKIGIPDQILLNRGSLSDAQMKIIRSHCEIGANILSSPTKIITGFSDIIDIEILENISKKNPFLQMAAMIALTHHEYWNGKGYPHNLSGNQIPIESRIVSIADVYDAIRSTRSYKPAYPHEQALLIMKSEVGSHFDPEVFSFFEENADEFEEVWETLQVE